MVQQIDHLKANENEVYQSSSPHEERRKKKAATN